MEPEHVYTQTENRQAKEAMLRAHFSAVRQLAQTHLLDKQRTEEAVKAVFRRAFSCMDEGEDSATVALKLHGFTLEEVLRLKAEEPPPTIDVYYEGGPREMPGYMPPWYPYPWGGAYPPPYSAYGQPPYAPPAYMPPQGYAPPMYEAPPQGSAASAPIYEAPPQSGAANARPPHAKEAQGAHGAKQAQAETEEAKKAAYEAAVRAEVEKRIEAQRKAEAERRAAEERLAAEKKAEEEAEDALGPAPYEGPGEEAPQFEPHEVTLTPEMQKKRRQRAMRARLVLGVNVLGSLMMIWVVLGLLRRIGVVPGVDLGYEWFNTTFFKMF